MGEKQIINGCLRIYRLLLLFYPREFRGAVGVDVEEAFGDRCRAIYGSSGVRGLLRLWPRTVRDVATNAAGERIEALGDVETNDWIYGRRGKREVTNMDSLNQDFRFAARRLLKQPALTLVIVLTLALGIGANTAIFSVVNAVLLNPLPFPDPDELLRVRSTDEQRRRILSASYPDYLDWRGRNETFENLAAFSTQSLTMTGQGPAEVIDAEMVSENYFRTLGVAPARGRDFLETEGVVPDSDPVVLLSDRFWRGHFSADPDLIGKPLTLNDFPYEVVGILPPGFQGFSSQADAWVLMSMRDTMSPSLRQYDFLGDRQIRWHSVIGRMRVGVSQAQAQADLEVVASQLAAAYPETNEPNSVRTSAVYDELVGDLEIPLYILSAVVGFVLLVACANIANLLLARAVRRQREMAVCVALGAKRGRLLRQMMSESLILALLGGALGVVVAKWSIPVLESIGSGQIPRFASVTVDLRVLAFTALATLLTAFLSGMVPALGGSRPDVARYLKGGGRPAAAGVGGSRLRAAFVVVQVTIALVLLVGAGLMVRSFDQIGRFEPGLRAENLMTMRVSIPVSKYEGQEIRLMQDLASRIEAAPAVESVAFTSHLCYGSGYLSMDIEAETAGEEVSTTKIYLQYVTPRYFMSMGIPLLQGREFSDRDVPGAPAVVVVSESYARSSWPGENPIGKRLHFQQDDPASGMEVVGLVGDVKPFVVFGQLSTFPEVYVPTYQGPVGGSPRLVVRTRSGPEVGLTAVREAVQATDINIPVFDVRSMEDLIADQTSDSRFVGFLMGLFALLTLLLAGVGVYAVIAHSVTQQTNEIGIRLALGARVANVLGQVMWQGMRTTIVGIAMGLIAAYWLSEYMTSLLFGVSPTDAVTFTGIPVILSVVALVACLVPALRATRVDPVVALREE